MRQVKGRGRYIHAAAHDHLFAARAGIELKVVVLPDRPEKKPRTVTTRKQRQQNPSV